MEIRVRLVVIAQIGCVGEVRMVLAQLVHYRYPQCCQHACRL